MPVTLVHLGVLVALRVASLPRSTCNELHSGTAREVLQHLLRGPGVAGGGGLHPLRLGLILAPERARPCPEVCFW